MGEIIMDEQHNSTYMGFDGPDLDAIHEAHNSEDLDYVARRGFTVNVGDRPQPDVPLPFITISQDRLSIRVRNTMKDVFRGVQLHLSETESHYAELEPTQPKDIIDAVVRYAEDAELAGYNGLTHTGSMPVYVMCLSDEQSAPIIAELEQRMTAIKQEEKRLAEKPLEQ